MSNASDAPIPTHLRHVPVLPAEVAEALALQPGQVYADATAGMGGHAIEAARVVGPAGTVILNDLDPDALERSGARLRDELGAEAPRIVTVRGNFAALPAAMAEQGLYADTVLADLGFSSAQMDDGDRGLSFRRDGPLDMRLDPSSPVTAAELVNELGERELHDILKRFGEEPSAGAIARKVVAARAEGPINSTGRLAEIVRGAVPPRRRRGPTGGGAKRTGGGPGIDPATRTFQALRIAVNDELGSLERFLAKVAIPAGGGRGWLSEGARVAIISFHSLEDRAVKRRFAELIAEGSAMHAPRGPVTATEQEIGDNPRSRSAKLRGVLLHASAPPGKTG